VTKRERVIRRAVATLETIDRETAKAVAADLRTLLPKRRPVPQHRKERAERKAAKGRHTAAVWLEVRERDGGRCVVCLALADDMHHLVYGSGLRTLAESRSTCACVCRFHHDRAHAGDLDTLIALVTWATPLGYGIACSALTRRIRKIEALRAPSGAKPLESAK